MASEQLKAVLELVGGADLGTLTLQGRRALMGSAGAPLPEGAQVDPVDANGVPAEWVAAAGVTGERVVLFFHGGAYHLGSPARLRGLLALLSAAAQARVLSAGYRLAPEHPFPAAVEDALTAYRWLIAGVATALGWIAWNLLLNETDASGFDVDAPVVMASWQDAGSGVLAFMVAALALTAYEPKETALRIVGSAALAGIVAFVFDIFVL